MSPVPGWRLVPWANSTDPPKRGEDTPTMGCGESRPVRDGNPNN